MRKKKVCLFTAHSPAGGGGGAILRSLKENINKVIIDWKYISDSEVAGYESGYMGKGFIGGNIFKDLYGTWTMLADRRNAQIDEIVNKLLAIECDAFWIVSHNEGLRIALELVRKQKDRPVHMTVHDDWAGALCARSRKYKLMASVSRSLTKKALQEVTNFDVISKGMQHEYLKLSGKTGDVCHRYLLQDAVCVAGTEPIADKGIINIGHIGVLYDKKDFIEFLFLVKDFLKKYQKGFQVHMWGYIMDKSELPEPLREHVNINASLPEKQVIEELAKCDFVYSMYPMSKALHMFSMTSLPTKLTSYMQSGRPIFGHAPADSTLAEFLQTTGLGVLWSAKNKAEGIIALDNILKLNPDIKQWQSARDVYFGDKNIEVMENAFV